MLRVFPPQQRNPGTTTYTGATRIVTASPMGSFIASGRVRHKRRRPRPRWFHPRQLPRRPLRAAAALKTFYQARNAEPNAEQSIPYITISGRSHTAIATTLRRISVTGLALRHLTEMVDPVPRGVHLRPKASRSLRERSWVACLADSACLVSFVLWFLS